MDCIDKSKQIFKLLPDFCMDYYHNLNTTGKTSGTILNYSYELRKYYEYQTEKDDIFDIKSHTSSDIRDYIKHLHDVGIKASGRSRSLSVLRSFYEFYKEKGTITNNPAKEIPNPTAEPAPRKRISSTTVKRLLSGAEAGEGLTPNQQAYAKNTVLRDCTIIALLSGTGIKVSTLCNLDIDDINWKNNYINDIKIGKIIKEYLRDYIEYERQPYDDGERALFISSRGDRGRLTPRSVQRLVQKYGAGIVNQKVTPGMLGYSFDAAFNTKLVDAKGNFSDIYLSRRLYPD